jgi:serine phosphatase RsbU (regulator of sigma subunit)/DNA-binding response OmpR family regulator/anti-sigma regulatory factor (Ser/Thr protein kinase)
VSDAPLRETSPLSPDHLLEATLTSGSAPDNDPLAVPRRSLPGEPPDANRPVGILLVDDHRENLSALKAVLEPLGERLISAESGEQALRSLLREDIALILLDVRMAGLDGLETARIIRSRPGTRHIPIIFLTAQASDVGEIALAYASGAVDYVIKPFEPEILRAKVSVFVELSRERSERVRQSHGRAQAEAVARTVRTLQILSDAALAHLELDGLSAELLERASTLFRADAAALLLRDESTPGLGVQATRGTALDALAEGRVGLGEGVLGQLAAERRPALVRASLLSPADPDPDDDDDDARPADPEAAAPSDDPPIATLLVVPLVTSNQLLGMLLLGAREERAFDDGDLELLTLAADRMAIAIDHVQRFAHGRQLVETLQRSLLPERLPRHPRLELAARYLPSGLAPQIGGDWYDALELDRDRTAVMIGDVVGHGVRAATTMSELRNALRAFAVEGHGPAAALHQLDRVVHATLGAGMVATVLVVVIDAAQGTVTLARAGHPPPARRRAAGTARVLETTGTLPLGVDEHVAPTEAEYPIEPGDTLLLFTDGLVERRRESISVGFDRLCDALASAPAEVEAICDHVLEQTLGAQASDDDVALMAVRLLPPIAGPLELTLPARAAAIPLARHRLRSWLTENAAELEPAARSDLEVAWSEACTNVVRHAYGPRDATFTATARRDDDTLVLEVSDTGGWREPRGLHGGRGLRLMRLLSDELVVDRGSDGTTVTIRHRVRGSEASSAESAVS